jgi:protein ImuB
MLCLWCPDWPVVAARRRDPELAGAPVVVLDRGTVLAASDEARAEGVRRGLRRREAEARCPGLVSLPADPAGESRAFEAVARALEVLTPRLALERPGLVFLPTRGPSRYFGGDAALGQRALDEVAGAGFEGARVGVADGAFAARLAARRAGAGEAMVVPPGGTPAFLAPFPVSALEDADLAGLLVRLGLPRLGDFAALPEAAVLGRFGEAGLAAQRRARGDEAHALPLEEPPPDLVEDMELDPPADRLDVAVFAGRALAELLLARLGDLGLACVRVRVEAETEHGERLTRRWRIPPGGLGPRLLAERVRWQLEAWVKGDGAGEGDLVTGGLTLLRLVPDEVVPAGGAQLGLWGGDRAAADRAARALLRVQTLLGPESVSTPVPQGGRTPAERVAWTPWGEGEAGEQPRPDSHLSGGSAGRPRTPLRRSGEGPPPWPGAVPPPAPARVFDPPRPAELLDTRGRPVAVSGRGEQSAAPARLNSPTLPGGGGAVEAWAGPWLHDLRWWDPPARRRRALWQVVAGGVACLVAVEDGRAGLEAIYD